MNIENELKRKENKLQNEFKVECINHAIEVLEDHAIRAGENSNYSILDNRLFEYQINNGIYSEEEENVISDNEATYYMQDIGYDIVIDILMNAKNKLMEDKNE